VTSGMRRRAIPVVMDFEASGFGTDSYPIEVGYIGSSGERFCSLIQPFEQWTHWDRRAEAVHGIRRELLQTHGQPPETVCDRLDRDLRGLTVYSDAWHHDLCWLHRLYDAAQRTPRFRLESIRSLLTEDEAVHWHAMLQAVHREVAGVRHRASTDAAAIQRALCLLMGIEPPPIGEGDIAPRA
jgi:hypothetical protein